MNTSSVEIVIPVYNEQHVLATSVQALREHMLRELAIPFAITIADNASTDATLELARSLTRSLPEVRVLRLEQKGRGRALRAAWGISEADVVIMRLRRAAGQSERRVGADAPEMHLYEAHPASS